MSRKKINYRWRCHACREANAPQDSKCARCGCGAIASDVEIEKCRSSNGIGTVVDTHHSEVTVEENVPPLNGAQKLTAAIGGVFMVGGATVERFTFPTMGIWYGALLAMGVGFLLFRSAVRPFKSPQ